jgi:hypothetical protein
LPIIVLQLGIFSTLLAGLFDLDGFWEMFWATFFAYLLAFSVFVTFRISSAYGALRCGLTNAKHNDKAVSGWRQKILFALVLILPLPMVLNAFWLVGSWRQVGGAVVGFAAALLVVFFVDFGQRLFNTFQGEHADSAKHLLLPFSYPFSSWAEEKDLASRVFSAPTFLRIQNWVHKLDPKYGIGIINRECVPASIYPGIVLGIALFFAFLSIYFVGFTFWIWQIGDGSLLLETHDDEFLPGLDNALVLAPDRHHVLRRPISYTYDHTASAHIGFFTSRSYIPRSSKRCCVRGFDAAFNIAVTKQGSVHNSGRRQRRRYSVSRLDG